MPTYPGLPDAHNKNHCEIYRAPCILAEDPYRVFPQDSAGDFVKTRSITFTVTCIDTARDFSRFSHRRRFLRRLFASVRNVGLSEMSILEAIDLYVLFTLFIKTVYT